MTAPAPPPGYGWAPVTVSGPPGQVRRTGWLIGLTVVTLGVYVLVWAYRVHRDMKRHTGQGMGGGVALMVYLGCYVLTLGLGPHFVTSSEVADLYRRKGASPPVTARTAFWTLFPGLVGFVLLLIVTVATMPSDTAVLGLVGVWLVGVLLGFVIWLGRTNDALNRYWSTLDGTTPQV